MDTPRTAMADRSFNATNDERHQFKAYYFGNLHQYHHIIQKNVDIPVLPDPGDAVLYRAVFQTPKIVCTTSDQDLDLIGGTECWQTSVKQL